KWAGWIGRKVNQIKGICAQEVAQMGFLLGLGGVVVAKVKMDSRLRGNDEVAAGMTRYWAGMMALGSG
uniref:hypothetical protein n=1 Tax=Halopseudomonas pelagia TaxID=553151 RepID=UPI00058B8943